MFCEFANRHLFLAATLSLILTACGGGGGGDEGVDDVNFGPGSGGSTFSPKPATETPNPGDGDVVVEEPPELDDIVVTEGNISVLVPGTSLVKEIEVDITPSTLQATPPLGFNQIGSAFSVTISDEDQELLNGPATITVTYDQTPVLVESNLVVLGFNGSNFAPLTILDRNQQANTITFETRVFDTLFVAEMDGDVPTAHDTGFVPAVNGWDIANFGTYFAPGGNSFGMAGYAAWFYSHLSDSLNGLYAEDTARIAAARAQMSQTETWGNQPWRNAQAYKDADLALMIKTFLDTFDEPLVLLLGQTAPSLAVTVYGYDTGGFFFYDPNVPGQAQYVTYDGTKFGTYNSLAVKGFASLWSFGRDTDFAALAEEATADFPGSQNVAIDSPTVNEQIDAREAILSGSLLNDLSAENDLYAEVKGVGRQLSVSSGAFSNVIEISHGINTIVALAGVDSSQENNWFKNAPTAIVEVEGTLPPARLLVTLTWEQDETDVDLYITEPGGETMWFGDSQTTSGLDLDIDDTTGFGPEHGTLEIGGTNVALEGDYLIRVHYYSDDGLGVPATGRVSIVVNEGEESQNTLSLRFRINGDNSAASGPDGEGTSWVDVAVVNILENTIDTEFPAASGN